MYLVARFRARTETFRNWSLWKFSDSKTEGLTVVVMHS